MTDGWTDTRRERGNGRGRSSAPRSLKAALSEAGLGDAGSGETSAGSRTRVMRRSEPEFLAIQSALRRAEGEPYVSSHDDFSPQPQLEPDEARHGIMESASQFVSPPRSDRAPGVVSPPPWLRAARRGRWQARFMNAFGWLVTIIVAGSIISVAGRYLAVPSGVEPIYTAQQ